MSDTIGNITVPALVSSGLTFPLTSDQNYGFTQDRPVIVHRFGNLDAKQEQRYAAGIGPRKFAFRRQHLSKREPQRAGVLLGGPARRVAVVHVQRPQRRPDDDARRRSPGSTRRSRFSTSPTPARSGSTSSRCRRPRSPIRSPPRRPSGSRRAQCPRRCSPRSSRSSRWSTSASARTPCRTSGCRTGASR